jgi:ABC-type polysaccharide/polyol phosphate export permease
MISAFALGIGLILATFAIHFPDVREMYQIILQAWMYFTPIIYPETILPEAIRYWILHLNPMYYMVNLFRNPVYNGVLPSANIVIISFFISIIALLIGWTYFSKQADTFPYRA